MKFDLLTKTDLRHLNSKLKEFEKRYVSEIVWLNKMTMQLQDRIKMLEDKLGS